MVIKITTMDSDGVVSERVLSGLEAIEFEDRRRNMLEEGRPKSISKVKLVRHLRLKGLWTQVRGRLNATTIVLREDWEFIGNIHRNDPVIAVLGLTKAELDDLYEHGQGA